MGARRERGQGGIEVAEGQTAPPILRCVNERKLALVVVGAHSRTGLARVARGSVAEHVARSTRASALDVRQAS